MMLAPASYISIPAPEKTHIEKSVTFGRVGFTEYSSMLTVDTLFFYKNKINGLLRNLLPIV